MAAKVVNKLHDYQIKENRISMHINLKKKTITENIKIIEISQNFRFYSNIMLVLNGDAKRKWY